MHPPLDVPRAPPRSSTHSSAIPRSTIAVLSEAVLVPGSPVASPGSASGSPSVCSTSYLGIRQPGHGNAAVVAVGATCMARISRCPARRVSNGIVALFKNVDPLRKPAASGTPCAVSREAAPRF